MPLSSFRPRRNPYREQPLFNPLRDQENLSGIGVFDFRTRCETFHIDVLARRERALHQILFAGNWNAIRKIALGYFGRRGWRGRSNRNFFADLAIRLNLTVRIERLLLWRILAGIRRLR